MSDKSQTFAQLQTLASQFSNWRQEYPGKHFPESLWEIAISLCSQSSVEKVSKFIGFPPHYLQRKLKTGASKTFLEEENHSETQFVELQVESPKAIVAPVSTLIQVHFEQHNGRQADISFSGKVGDLSLLIREFFVQEGE